MSKRVTPQTLANWMQIPPMPVDGFKMLTLTSVPEQDCEAVFTTSGTTHPGQRGRNFHPDLQVWDESMIVPFRHFIMPDRERIRIAVLSPAWDMNEHSSLSRYLTRAVEQCGAEGSGFFFHEDGLDFTGVERFLDEAAADGEPVMLMGASSAYLYLLDYLDKQGKTYALAADSRVFDTGGFKSTRTDMTVDDVCGVRTSVRREALALREHVWHDGVEFAVLRSEHPVLLHGWFVELSQSHAVVVFGVPRSGFAYAGRRWRAGCDRALRSGELEFVPGYSDGGSGCAHRTWLCAERSCEGRRGAWLFDHRRRGDGGQRMSDVDIFHAPRDFEFHDFDTRNVTASDGGTATLRFPRLDADAVHALAASVRRHRAEKLARYSTDGIVDVIARAKNRGRIREYPERRLAERLIPAVTGYDASMVRIELKWYTRMFRRCAPRFVDDELNCPQMLDEYRPNRSGGYTRLYGPELSFHVFSSNVPGIPVWSMTMGLLTKSAILGKSSFDEPLMPVLFARSLASVDPDMADALAIVPWRGGTVDLEDAAIGEADAVVAYGSSHTTEAIRPRVRAGKPFLSYGANGFSLIGREGALRATYAGTVHRMAIDVATYDQQSCLAPQTMFVERGGAMSPAQVAELLASELDGQQRKYPRSTPSGRGVHGDSAVAFHRADESADAGAGPMAAAAGNADAARRPTTRSWCSRVRAPTGRCCTIRPSAWPTRCPHH